MRLKSPINCGGYFKLKCIEINELEKYDIYNCDKNFEKSPITVCGYPIKIEKV
jgi:hypothetical protein